MPFAPLRKPVIACAAVAVLLSWAAQFTPGPKAAGAAEDVRITENVRLFAEDSRAARGRDRPGLAVNPADPNHVVAVDEDFVDGTCSHHVSFDAGRTWASGELQAPATYPSPPCVQFDTGGWSHTNGSVAFGSGQNVYTTFTSFRSGEGDSILVSRSTDGGRSFAPAVVAVAGLPGGRSINIRPTLAVLPREPGDQVVVVYWGCETPGVCSGTHRAHSIVSEDGGQSWGSPVFLNLPTDGPAPYPSPPAIGPDGTFYVTFRRTATAASVRGTLVLATSKNDGASWTYEDIGVVSGFTEQKLVADRRDGTLYLAYHATAFGADQDIVFQRRPAGSSAWSKPLRVNDDPLEADVVQRFPWMSLSPDGGIHLLWHDQRHPYPGNALDDYYYATSSDGGQTFSPNRRVTDRTINLAVGLSSRIGTFAFYWPAMAPVGDGALIAAWPDSREGSFDNDNQDIYSARLEPRTGARPPSRTISAPTKDALAAALSRLAFPGGHEVGTPGSRTTAPTTSQPVIVNGDDAAAAVAGAVLARARVAPVLLSGADGLPTETKDEIVRFGPKAAFVLGDESRLSPKVLADLEAAGVPPEGITRIAAGSPAELAKKLAELLDTRSGADKLAGKPAFAAAVIADPSSPEAASAAAMAAALRLPYLFVERDSVPQATADALRSLAINRTLIIGGTNVVSGDVESKMPKPKRLEGSDPVALSAAINTEARALGLPTNVIYATGNDDPVGAAVMGAAVARLGGAMVMVPGADAASIDEVERSSGLDGFVDRRVIALRAADPTTVAATGARAAGRPESPTLPATGGTGSVSTAAALAMASIAVSRLVTRSRRRHNLVRRRGAKSFSVR